MRNAHLLSAIVALVPTLAAVHAAALTPIARPQPAPDLIKPLVTAATTPTLGTGAILGAVQVSAMPDGGNADCTAWTAQACAATAPSISSNGTSGSCSSGTYIECCPTQAAVCGPWLAKLYDQTFQANLGDAGATFNAPQAMPALGTPSAGGLGYAAAPVVSIPAGTQSTVIGNQTALFTSAPYVGSGASATSQMFGAARGAYGSTWQYPRFTGQAITSCDSYVWQKWAGYARWEDAARAGVNDPVFVASQAYSVFINPPLRSDGASFSANGTPFQFAHTIGQTIPRNAFFSFVPTWLSTTDPTQSAILASIQNEQAHPFVLGTSSSDPGWDQNDLQWIDGCTSQEAGCSSVAGPFPWVYGTPVTMCTPIGGGGGRGGTTQMIAKAATLPNCTVETEWNAMTFAQNDADDDAFASEQARLDAYSGLLSELGDLNVSLVVISREISAYQSSGGKTTQLTSFVAYPQIAAPLLSASATPVASAPTPSFSSYYFPDAITRRSAAVSYLNQAATLAASIAVPAPTAAAAGSTLNTLQTALASVQAQIAATQAQITQALVTEWSSPSKGCLLGLVDGQYANSCDWSPQTVVQSYLGMFESQRQAAYNRCIADTGDQFPVPSETAFVAQDLQDPAQWMDNLTDFETYLGKYENRAVLNAEALVALQAAQKAYLTESNGLPVGTDNCSTGAAANCSATVGWSAGDTHKLGGSFFGASVTYGAGWSATMNLQPLVAPVKAGFRMIQSVDADVNGSIHGTATVFSQTVDVFDAQLDATSKPGSAAFTGYVSALGNDLYTAPGAISAPVTATVSDPVASPGFSVIIPILCIPVKVSAGISLTVGVKASAAVTPPPVTPSTTNLTTSVSGSLAPFAEVDAWAQVGVDLVLVSVGIEGSLTLIKVSVPVNGTLSIGSQNGSIALMSNVNANLSLNELSGEIDLYGEVDLGFWSDKAKIYLANWNGFHQEIPLFNPINQSWPIDAIDYLLFNQSNPDATN